MRELVLTGDAVLVTFVETLLKDAGIEVHVFDRNLNALNGAVGPAPQRVMVASGQWQRAKRLLVEADLERWIVE